jgi:subtilase family serine protease
LSPRLLSIVLPVFLLASLFSSLSHAAAPDRITGAIDPSKGVALKGHVAHWARPQFDQGPVESSRTMRVTMLFMPTAQQLTTLKQLVADQQDTSSPRYHQWLTAQQFGQQFGLSQADIGKIRTWLQGQGLTVTYVAKGQDYLCFEGSAALVQSTFQTQIHQYSVDGKMHFGNVTAPVIPAALSGIVGGFRGMHDFFPHSMIKKHADYTVAGFGTHILAPGDLATIYDINPLYQLTPSINGSGENIVIAGQSDVYLADLVDYRTAFSLSTISGCTLDTATHTVIQAGACTSENLQVVWPGGTGDDPGINSGDLGESDLDIETVSAVARGAKIIFVTSSNGVDESASYAIDNQLAPVISYSYGLCEAYVTAPDITTAETTYMKADAEGISFFAASGDAAAATCDGDNGSEPAILGLSVSYPASSAYLTGVGGTEFNEGSGTYWNTSNNIPGDGGSAKSYIPEIAWNDTTISVQNGFGLDGTGGGPSNCAFGSGTGTEGGFEFEICKAPPNGGFPKPTWQNGVTPADSVRDVPDISFSASNANDLYLVCTAESEIGNSGSTSTCQNGVTAAITAGSIFGGTSASTPLAASVAILLNQYLKTTGLGNVNPQLYKLYGTTPSIFHDINTGTSTVGTEDTSNNMVPCTAGTPVLTGFPSALQCPSTGSFGFSVAGGHKYSTVTGLGSLDVNALVTGWLSPDFTLTVTPTSTSVVAGHTAPTSGSITVTIAPINGLNQAVTPSCTGLPTGATCAFTPTTVTPDGTHAATTTMTISTASSMAAATTAITISATGSGVTHTTGFSLTTTATDQSFTLAAQPSSYSVSPGQTVNATIILTGTNGFSTPVTYTCGSGTGDGVPESMCTGPTGPTAKTTIPFALTTTAPTSSQRQPFGRSMRIFYAALLPGLLGIMFTAGSRKRSFLGRRWRGMRLLGMICVLGFSTLWLGSCSGSGGGIKNAGTTAGTYTVTINATTAGANPQTASTSFTVVVN